MKKIRRIGNAAATYDRTKKSRRNFLDERKNKNRGTSYERAGLYGHFVVLAVLLILLFVFMFGSKKDESAKETMKYTPGKYTSSILFNDNSIDVEVVVDENRINSVSLVNLDESVATMYPLMQPALDAISQQIYENQSLEGIDYGSENQYTSQVLVEAIRNALSKAEEK